MNGTIFLKNAHKSSQMIHWNKSTDGKIDLFCNHWFSILFFLTTFYNTDSKLPHFILFQYSKQGTGLYVEKAEVIRKE